MKKIMYYNVLIIVLSMMFMLGTGITVANVYRVEADAVEIESQDDTVAVGNSNSYRSSGGSSHSSSSSSRSSSSRSSSSSGSSRSSSSGSSSNLSGILYLFSSTSSLIRFIIVAAVIMYILKKRKGAGSQGTDGQGNISKHTESTMYKNNVAEKIKEHDANFDEEKFLAWTHEIFLALQDAWTKKDWSKIRPFEAQELFNEHSKQLQEYKENGTTNIISRIAIDESTLDNYYVKDGKEYIECCLITRHIDYIQNDNTGKIIAGDTETLWDMGYDLTFVRTLGTQTPSDGIGELNITNCPNCGAPTAVTSAGECEYCHSVITTGKYNWVLIKYHGQNL